MVSADDLREALLRVTRERDEYASQVHDLTLRVTAMTSAATSAAASTITAIERIQEFQVIVDAAAKWRQSAGLPGIDLEAARELRARVDEHLARVRSRS